MLLIDSAAGLLVFRLTRWTIQLAEGDPARLMLVYTLLGSVIALPAVFVGTYLLAVAAPHRLGDRTRRWLLLGMGIYAVVRTATVLASGQSPELGVPKLVIIGALVLTVPMLTGIAMLGARRAHKTQAAYYAKVYFRRLNPADQEAMVTLLDETVAVRKN